MIERLEWIGGPVLMEAREPVERGGVQVRAGRKRRLLLGQLRDRELGHVHGWVMEAPRSNWQTLVRIERLKLDVPKGKNWTGILNHALFNQIPKGFTIPPDGSLFERGIII
jgi:hypothetical protein